MRLPQLFFPAYIVIPPLIRSLRCLELVERLNSLAGAGQDTENVEADL